MKKVLFVGVVAFSLIVSSVYAESASQEIIDYAKNVLAAHGADPVIVQSVETENAKGKSLDEIQSVDKLWMETSGISEFMKTILDNPCTARLQEIKNSNKAIVEIFVTDNQGANVAMTDKTSDYWQGDEARFVNSFAAGKGEVYLSDVNFDESTQTYVVQVSVPVKNSAGAVGTITFSIDVDNI